jgi:glycosyltransferase involved in cell wall biosynthesis
MKVLHVIPSLAPSYGGPRQTVLEFCQQSQNQCLHSEICATDADGSGHLNVELNQPVVYEGIACHFFRCQASASLNYSRPLSRWLDENVEQYDVVHINGIFCHATYAAATACARRGVPYVVSPHGMLEPWSMSQKRPRKVVAWHLFYRRVLEQAAAIVYSTQQERDLTERALNLSRGVILPAGVPASLLQVHRGEAFHDCAGIPRNEPFLIALSRIHPKKGVNLLLKAFLELKTQGHLAAWHLVVAGDGEMQYVNQLRKFVRGTTAEPFVHWPGWLQGAEKFQALAEAGLFVLTSFQENFGRGVIEAMACGTPALVSPQVGLAPTIAAARAGWIVDLHSDDLRRGLIEATGDFSELSTRAKAARQVVRDHFIWPLIVEDTIALYDRVSAGKRSRETTPCNSCSPCETQ